MASVHRNRGSSLALAFAGISNTVNVPKPREGFWAGKDSFAAVAARPVPSNKQTAALPTPPNSISPTLPAQGFKGHLEIAPLTPPAHPTGGSDIDLQDAVEHAKAQDQPQHGRATIRGSLADIDAAGNITPGLLAKHHLPGILLEHGPLAIRHITGFLTTFVPGFSGIPPAKARRLVVAALEGRAGNGEQANFKIDVIFEKVGWGRWDARRRGQPSRDSRTANPRSSLGAPAGVWVPGNGARPDRNREMGTSMGGREDSEMEYDTPPEDISMLEHEADKMSLDEEDDSCSASEPPDDSRMLDAGLDDVTDEEDWASIGAAALRAGSFPKSAGRIRPGGLFPPHLDPKSRGRGGGPPSSMLAKSMPMPRHAAMCKKREQAGNSQTEFPATGDDAEQRAAVEALLKLASV